jgi:hypothetical protein
MNGTTKKSPHQKFRYQYHGKLRIEAASGAIATNGQHLWVHNKSSSFCARPNVGGDIVSSVRMRCGGETVAENPLNS